MDALNLATTGQSNTAHGWHSLSSNTTGSFNTAYGESALFTNADGGSNTAVGYQAMHDNVGGANNTAFGIFALRHNSSGDSNTAIGEQALQSNTSGKDNTALGLNALYKNNADKNTALGEGALQNNLGGTNNIGIGYSGGDQLITGSYNIDIGSGGGSSDDHTIRIGDVQTHTYIAGIFGAATINGGAIPVVVDSNGNLGTTSSSERFKKDIKPMDNTSDMILSLDPVTFHYKNDNQNVPQFGLVAEQVAKVNPDLIIRDKDGKPLTVRYEAVNAMLLNEFLKEHKKVQELEAKLKQLDARIQVVNDKVELTKPAPQTVDTSR